MVGTVPFFPDSRMNAIQFSHKKGGIVFFWELIFRGKRGKNSEEGEGWGGRRGEGKGKSLRRSSHPRSTSLKASSFSGPSKRSLYTGLGRSCIYGRREGDPSQVNSSGKTALHRGTFLTAHGHTWIFNMASCDCRKKLLLFWVYWLAYFSFYFSWT